ncbi:hypothetical protein [Vibrio sp. MACH09]|nr:hypothetical protein [Vibrio sp. MACH09]
MTNAIISQQVATDKDSIWQFIIVQIHNNELFCLTSFLIESVIAWIYNKT